MNWYYLVFIAVIGTSAFSAFVKLSHGKIDPILGTVLLQFAAFILVALYYGGKRSSLDSAVVWTSAGVIYSLLAGVFIVIANLCIFYIYHYGAPLSIAAPMMRVGSMILVVLIGIFLFKENLDHTKILGLILSITGIYLLAK
jgi:drug/metabolite transporter (DMT)-like permease